MFDNTVFLKDISDYQFNFNNKLNYNNSLHLINCNNIDIKLTSKINKIVIINCNDINLKICNLISGFEISKSHDINIKVNKNKNINCIEIFNSMIRLNKKKGVIIINENSKIF